MHRGGAGDLPVAVAGNGCYLIDSTGRRYLDASGGAAVSCLGHSHPRIIAAIQEQVGRLAFAHTSFFTNAAMEELADVLIADAPPGMATAYFVAGGSEAVEAALKLARQYFVEIGEPQRRHFIARRQSYHGNTLGALAVGGNAWRRALFSPHLIETHHIAPCYAYRDRRHDESDAAYGKRVADELEAKVLELGAALAVQRTIKEDGLLDAVQQRGAELAAILQDRFGNHHHIGDVRGRGLFIGLELVADRASKEPFDPDLKLHARVKREAMARGLMCYPAGGTIDGRRGDHVLLAPPYIIRSAEIAELVDKLGDAIDAAIASM